MGLWRPVLYRTKFGTIFVVPQDASLAYRNKNGQTERERERGGGRGGGETGSACKDTDFEKKKMYVCVSASVWLVSQHVRAGVYVCEHACLFICLFACWLSALQPLVAQRLFVTSIYLFCYCYWDHCSLYKIAIVHPCYQLTD